MDITAKLDAKGLSLPETPAPSANYVPFVISGDLVFVSGQISMDADGALIKGKLGADMDTAAGAKAAERCALSLLAQLGKAVGGDFSRLGRAVKLTGFVNSTPDFTEQPKVVNGCSDLLVDILGEKGRHARSAVSVASLPLGVAVEVEAIFQLA